MKTKNTGHTVLAMGLMLVGYSSAMAVEPVGSTFSYQGRLTQQDQLVDQPTDLRFTLWDAEVAGNQIAGAVNLSDWPIENGLFTVELDFGSSAFLGEGRYLEIEVRTPAGQGEFVTLVPRQRLSPTPYAIGLNLPYRAEYSTPGNLFEIANLGLGRSLNVQISNRGNGEPALNALTDGAGPAGAFRNHGAGDAINALVSLGTGTAVRAESGGVGVHGIHTSRGGATPGVIGETGSSGTSAIGVLGRVTSESAGGLSAGVRGINEGTQNFGIGVYGSQEGSGWGVYGTAPSGRGVYGHSDSGTGVHGTHQSNTGSSPGVFGETGSSGAGAIGVLGRVTTESAGSLSAGVRGINAGTRSVGIGVYGSQEGSGWGVYGTTPSGRGVYGHSDSGTGVYGMHQGTGGTSPGVFGSTRSFEPQSAGVSGRASATGTAQTYGVYGESMSVLGVGVGGVGADGVRGLGSRYGVYGEATAATGIGVFALGSGGRNSEPALLADNFNSTAILANGAVAVRGQGTEIGVEGITFNENGVGGYFANIEGGMALEADGRVEIDGDTVINGMATVEVLQITGADLAERFPISEEAEPGMVVEIDPQHPGSLCVSRSAYNQRVAGVISGANDLSAGVVLGNLPGSESHLPVALNGRVWVHTDATHHAVEPGAMMTTAYIPGYAMPVVDRDRAAGAIIGKAMTSLPKGETGLVLVLVNLQ